MPRIPLTQGFFAIVDDEDFESLSQFKWQLHRSSSVTEKHYARRTYREGGRTVGVYMHRAILPDAQEVDHIDGDGLNNVRSNLRSATRSEQMRWRPKNKNRSGYKGVYPQSRSNRWCVKIQCGSTRYNLGTFDTPEEAALAYNAKAVELFGDFAFLNDVPDEQQAA